MILFLDTSVLVKLYHNEDGSERIEEIAKDGISAIALSG
jgi:predicted nucleic acid-binding protein